jgi:membrane protein implicated in regulation of membrane protease activity
MLTLYLVSAIVAGVLIILSLVGADHDHDHEVHLPADDLGHEVDHPLGGHWLPFFSLRFYTYFFAAFGVTGLLLTYFSDAGTIMAAWVAGIVGLLSGLSVSIVMRLLRLSEATGSASDKDVLGKEAEVLVPIRGLTPGRIRCTVRGDIIDFLAVSEQDRALEPGEKVVVVSMDNGRANVVSAEAIFADALTQKVNQ